MKPSLEASYRFCCDLSRREATNFYYSFLVLPPARRRSMCAPYAFLRRTDDLADEPGLAAANGASLEAWRRSLDQALCGGHDWPGFPALADTVHRHAIPPRLLHEVIDGVLMDLDPRLYQTFEDLYTYCYRVASVVGLSCLHIWGYRSDGGRAEAMAEACGIALQLTNILRDVREDAQRGRIYLPSEDLNRFGVGPEELVARHCSPQLKALLKFEGERAYDYYRRAASLIRLVAPVGRPVLNAIVGIYRALLDEIARRDFDVLAGRIALPALRKATITVQSLVRGVLLP